MVLRKINLFPLKNGSGDWWIIVIGQRGFAMRDTLMRDETSSGERLRMGILGILVDMGTPGVAGLQVKGVWGQSHRIGSSPLYVERILTHYTQYTHFTQYTHARVPFDRTDRLRQRLTFFCFFSFLTWFFAIYSHPPDQTKFHLLFLMKAFF